MIIKHHDVLNTLRHTNPLILNVTNHVSMDFVANGLLSVGASPIMTLAEEEIEDLMRIAHAVVINLGTLNEAFIRLCHKACACANQYQKPIIFDPVGVGASAYRTQTAQSLLAQYAFEIIRANASEIMALSGGLHRSKGVDSSLDSGAAIEGGHALSHVHQAVVVISGAQDHIIHQHQRTTLTCGSVMMPQITGTGCLLTAVTGAFRAVHSQAYEAATMATAFYGQCGETAAAKAQGPGTFKPYFLDALHAEEKVTQP